MVIQANGKEYHSVEIQLENVLIPDEKVKNTPSMEEGKTKKFFINHTNCDTDIFHRKSVYSKKFRR